MRSTMRAVWMIVSMFLICGCAEKNTTDTPNSKASEPSAPPVVYTVNYPLAYFAERIGGDAIDVHMPAPKNEDPAYWKPSIETITAYQDADLILLNGAGYAKWVDSVSLPSAKMLNTGKPFEDNLIALTNDVTHTHGPDGNHAHGAVAFTTWLDPTLAIQQAEAIKAALTTALPEQRDTFEQNYLALKTDLLALDGALQAALAQNNSRPVIFSHPVYQYLERRYGLNGKSVHWEPDEAPSDPMWKELQELLTDHPAKWIIWEGAPMPETVAKLKAMDIHCIVFAPCGNAPDQGDYLSVMDANIKALKPIFEN
jgi:zinc transport system substrate-binding protein